MFVYFNLIIINNREGADVMEMVLGAHEERLRARKTFFRDHESQ